MPNAPDSSKLALTKNPGASKFQSDANGKNKIWDKNQFFRFIVICSTPESGAQIVIPNYSL